VIRPEIHFLSHLCPYCWKMRKQFVHFFIIDNTFSFFETY
jgi:hypothetical protein